MQIRAPLFFRNVPFYTYHKTGHAAGISINANYIYVNIDCIADVEFYNQIASF